mmetsp:Transcript_31712/g.68636  ORF Transcript_31712/g.68636 Transcript_31712/m.68636 type:complete len:294 (-) Transcript_31712:161-1042(-)
MATMSSSYSLPRDQEKESATHRFKQRASQEFQNLTDRLSAFGEKAKQVLTGNSRPGGQYQNLSESLLSDDTNDDANANAINNSATGGGGDYMPVQMSGPGGAGHQSAAVPGMADVPSQAELMVQTTMLAKEAAELLWETIAYSGGKDGEMKGQLKDLAEKADLLASQLRGLIRNHLQQPGGAESILADALEAKDMLDSCLSEYNGPSNNDNNNDGNTNGGNTNNNGMLEKVDTQDILEAPPLIQLDDQAPPANAQAGAQQLPQSNPPVDPFASFDALTYPQQPPHPSSQHPNA